MSGAAAFLERFWSKVDVGTLDECWEWTAGRFDTGYGAFHVRPGVKRKAHVIAFILTRGPVPADLDLDHDCRNRRCVNPWHLTPKTNRDNILAGTAPAAINARKTHCVRGHPLTPENVYLTPSGGRSCRLCIQLRRARQRL